MFSFDDIIGKEDPAVMSVSLYVGMYACIFDFFPWPLNLHCTHIFLFDAIILMI